MTIEQCLAQGLTAVETAVYLNEGGFPTPGKKAWNSTHVKGYIPRIQERWQAQTASDVATLRASQHAEIRVVKKELHKRGDYRTLGTFIKMESELLGTNVPRESETNVNHNMHLTVEHRVAALQAASEVEKELLGGVGVLEDDDIIDVEGVIISEPIDSEMT